MQYSSHAIKPIIANPITNQAMEAAVRTLIAYTGDNPDASRLIDTPNRVTKAWAELFSGYALNGEALLTANRVKRASGQEKIDIKYIRSIPFTSYCEHHILPIIGHIHIAIQPNKWQVNEETIIELAEIYARRLQIQEKMNAQIMDDLMRGLEPLGCGVIIKSIHHCMATRGVLKKKSTMLTSNFKGIFKDDMSLQTKILYELSIV